MKQDNFLPHLSGDRRKALLSCRSPETKLSWCLCTNCDHLSTTNELGLQEHFWNET